MCIHIGMTFANNDKKPIKQILTHVIKQRSEKTFTLLRYFAELISILI